MSEEQLFPPDTTKSKSIKLILKQKNKKNKKKQSLKYFPQTSGFPMHSVHYKSWSLPATGEGQAEPISTIHISSKFRQSNVLNISLIVFFRDWYRAESVYR